MEEKRSSAQKTIQELNDTIQRSNIRVTGVPEDVEREARLQDVFKRINENLPHYGERNSQIQAEERPKQTETLNPLKKPQPWR